MLNDKITLDLNPALFITTFATSVLTATLGIAKFLKTGPCRLLPDQGPLGGHGTLPFFMLMLNIFSIIINKGFILPAIGWGIPNTEDSMIFQDRPLTQNPIALVGVWLAICYLPQLIYVRFVLHYIIFIIVLDNIE